MAMHHKRLVAGLLMAAGAATLPAAPAAAQISRTWVSGVGDDVNPCTRTAPCKTFQGAIAKTSAGGEINCLDPGGWGPVEIYKSITIDCSQFPGSINNPGLHAIGLVLAPTDKVVIRGLVINSSSPGLSGIRFLGSGTLILENVAIRGNTYSGGPGINFSPNGSAELYLSNVTISNNGMTGYGGGVDIAPRAGGSAKVVVINSRFLDNDNFAFRADTSGTTVPAGVQVTVTGSVFSGNTHGFVMKAPAGAPAANAMLIDSVVSENSGQGLLVTGSSTLRVRNSVITGNGTAMLYGGGGTIQSYGNNVVAGNVNQTTGFSSLNPVN